MMKKWMLMLLAAGLLVLGLGGCGAASENTTQSQPQESTAAASTERHITVSDGTNVVVFALNDSDAANALWAQLPLTIAVENYSSNEKIFYPDKLETSHTPAAQGQAGALAYYAPWGDVVMFYQGFKPSDKLYELGKAVSGQDNIQKLSGTLTITRD